MRRAVVWLTAVLCGAALLAVRRDPIIARAGPPIAINGQVTSAEEGPMEGVLVSAKQAGSTITVTVVSDRDGRYRFPASRLERGEKHAAYSRRRLRSRQCGQGDRRAAANDDRRSASAEDARPRRAADQRGLVRELSRHRGAEGIDPGLHALPHARADRPQPPRRRRIDGGHRAHVDLPAALVPLKMQKLPAPRIGGGAGSPEQQPRGWRRQARISRDPQSERRSEWSYALKTGRAEGARDQVIYTEYDLPQRRASRTT